MSRSNFQEKQTATQVPETILSLSNVTKRYDDTSVIRELSLEIHDGEIITFLGPSGCGKTTTLRLIAGLERPTDGVITLRDEPVAGNGVFKSPEARGVGVVFQEFALFPHLTAAENIAFGLKDRPEHEREDRVSDLLELVGLTDHHDCYPEALSGGQQQRVALARSLAPNPDLLLLDEPFSNLDVDLRVTMREEVRRIIKDTGVTAISVTHDQEEAFSISDRVAVMNNGQIEQVGVPETVFQQPKSRFVAGFLGHASFLPGLVKGEYVDTRLVKIPRSQIHGLHEEYDDSLIDVLVRPDDFIAVPSEPENADGRVVYRRYLGPTVLYRVELGSGETIECMHNHADQVELDEFVTVELAADHELAWFPQHA